ncbi:MAG TPA: 50S ribosomal protein L11 methyltransferase, partial [Firmicutes bacterium]|nr:50S ribosomal protein L11 methyltransferase [Bacillota bacterium]
AIIMLAPDVPDYLVPGGFFLAAGIIEGRRDETLRAIADAGLKIREIHQDGEWITVYATKG